MDIGVKWPNDLYANSDMKIGGLIVTSVMEGETAICNVGEFHDLNFKKNVNENIYLTENLLGLGVNLSNSIPTTSINDMISAYNKKNSKSLPPLTYEKTLALIFNEMENIMNRVQNGDLEYLYDLYYKCWLHRFVILF